MAKRIISALLLAVLTISHLVSCSSEVTFTHAELAIVLDSSFSSLESEQYDLLLDNEEVSVGVKRISLYAAGQSGIPDSFSPLRFAQFVLDERGETAEIFSYGDIPYFTLYETVSGIEFYTLYTFYRSKYAYFIIAFASLAEDEGEHREEFFGFADSVYFTS